MLPSRWTSLNHHETQQELIACRARFIVNVAGRRSGKTEIAKRRLWESALDCTRQSGRFIAGAPTYGQAKRIYWEDLKAMAPQGCVRQIKESELTIVLVNGARISCVGFDKPVRAEGDPIDGIVLDEYADMKPSVWTQTVRPGLSTMGRPGWANFIGKPRGRNHFWRLWQDAATRDNWARFHWSAEEILSAQEIQDLRDDLPDMEYQQEIQANFVNFSGRAYYAFTDENKQEGLHTLYDPQRPLEVSLDFNIAPGTAAITQEMDYSDVVSTLGIKRQANVEEHIDATFGQVWIPRDSNTHLVCDKIIADWGKHEGPVHVFGDATGGAGGSAKVQGSDWILIKNKLKPVFGERLKFKVQKGNPPVKERLNGYNGRFRTASEKIRTLVDPVTASRVVEDLEGVTLKVGSNGELDKNSAPELTHISDGLGYRAYVRFPMRSRTIKRQSI